MTVTPVGMRCPECARERTKVTRITPGIHLGRAPATYILIAINVIAFIAEVGSGAPLGTSFAAGGSVYRDFSLFGPAVANGEWYRLLTAGFLHAGLLHILFNMVALYFLGSLLEPGIGTPRFLAVYFVSLLAGSFGALLITPDTHTVGASGAVFGLMSAAFIVARHRGVEQLAGQIGFYIIINIFFTIGVSGISIGGHFGGLIAGALCGFLIVFAERRVRRPVELEVLGMTALAVLSVVGAIAVA
ncbi:MAG TPA: rhomboid family intramembrane serine protease [Solirubrobacterales bacterium]|jgi:membrane associated rhomboid family serine protease|nr:rhomboid family intramembrane serine protease [Solirubrobacterales bacterium]